MDTKQHFTFVKETLLINAREIGIDIDESLTGLIEAYNLICGLGMEASDDDRKEAERLIAKYGDSEAGEEMLMYIGSACLCSDGLTWMTREWESEGSLDSATDKQLEVRSLCDFALFTGVAIAAISRYGKSNVYFSKLGVAGAAKRYAPLNELKSWAIEKYKLREWKSANAAAFELKDEVIAHGRIIGAPLAPTNAQRTLAEWFRSANRDA